MYLLPPGEWVLRLAVLSGDSPELGAPWARVRLTAPVPVADAVRERRLVWLGSQEELARRYALPFLRHRPVREDPRGWVEGVRRLESCMSGRATQPM